jgi:hypothetical protein
VGRPPLDGLHEAVDAELRITADEQVDVFRHDLHLDHLRFRLRPHIANDLLEACVDRRDENLSSVLRAPDDMVIARKSDVTVGSVLSH